MRKDDIFDKITPDEALVIQMFYETLEEAAADFVAIINGYGYPEGYRHNFRPIRVAIDQGLSRRSLGWKMEGIPLIPAWAQVVRDIPNRS